jgi:hypothetical protein
MRNYISLLCVCWPVVVCSQFVDDFSDGDFINNPAWTGDHEKFFVAEGMLKLNADDAGMAYLSTQSEVMADTQWEFWVRIAFIPSDNNHPRIYLVSDKSDLTAPLNGYFVQIGKTGGDNKRMYFYRQDGEEVTQLLAGSMNLAESSNNIMRIRVLRDAIGNWQLNADGTGGKIFMPQGEVFDPVYTSTSWFGIRCNYTSSNSKRFYFDDFYVGDVIPEGPPQVESLEVTSPNTLEVVFSRVVSHETAADVSNYSVDGGIGHPLVVSYDQQIPNMVSLLFFKNFETNTLYTMDVSGVESPDGQVMESWKGEFVHYVSSRFDVIFNELMVNSRPEVELPPYDWLELYNTTGLPLNLNGWVFQHGTTKRTLPDAHIPPKGFLVLTTEEAFPALEGHGNVVSVPGLSATALTIGGTDLMLWDDNERLVSFVSYSSSWYRDAAKADGGWSLEKIDAYNFCEGAANWKASKDIRGGTPGETNSVVSDNPDTTVPRLLRAAVIDSLNVRLSFSEPMDEALLWVTDNYDIDHGIGSPATVKPVEPDFSRVDLLLESPLERGVTYMVEVAEEMVDCAGNAMAGRKSRLAMPESASAFDVVINEVLFNPPDRGARYVELFNRSEKVFDLADLLLSSKDTIDDVLITVQHISVEGWLIFPGDYVVLTNDTAAVQRTFLTPDPDAFVDLAGMPRMTNTQGHVVLATKGHLVVDEFVYCEEMHLPLLANVKGVALERLHPHRPTQDDSNWHSAAASAGFGTPGYQNSQFVSYSASGDTRFEVYPKVFAPDGSGLDDVLNIHYDLGEPGYVANVRIFDSRGRLVRTLVQGELLAARGTMTWDGTTSDRLKAPIGVYVIHAEVFNQYGDVRHYKLTGVLAGQL